MPKRLLCVLVFLVAQTGIAAEAPDVILPTVISPRDAYDTKTAATDFLPNSDYISLFVGLNANGQVMYRWKNNLLIDEIPIKGEKLGTIRLKDFFPMIIKTKHTPIKIKVFAEKDVPFGSLARLSEIAGKTAADGFAFTFELAPEEVTEELAITVKGSNDNYYFLVDGVKLKAAELKHLIAMHADRFRKGGLSENKVRIIAAPGAPQKSVEEVRKYCIEEKIRKIVLSSPPQKNETLIITIAITNGNTEFYINGKSRDSMWLLNRLATHARKNMGGRLSNNAVLIRADARVPWKAVQLLQFMCLSEKIYRISFMVRQAGGDGNIGRFVVDLPTENPIINGVPPEPVHIGIIDDSPKKASSDPATRDSRKASFIINNRFKTRSDHELITIFNSLPEGTAIILYPVQVNPFSDDSLIPFQQIIRLIDLCCRSKLEHHIYFRPPMLQEDGNKEKLNNMLRDIDFMAVTPELIRKLHERKVEAVFQEKIPIDFEIVEPADNTKNPAEYGPDPRIGRNVYTRIMPVKYGYRYSGRRAAALREGGSNRSESAVYASLRWLARHQEDDGHWDNVKYEGSNKKHDNAQTHLALLAFLGAGHTEKAGIFRKNVKNAVKWIESTQGKNGAYGDGWAYTHATGGLAMAEAAGMANVKETIYSAQKAVDYSVNIHQISAGANKGGWSYSAKAPAANISCSGWFILQLKSAKVAGLTVPNEGFKGAVTFLDSVEVKGSKNDPSSGHRYRYTAMPDNHTQYRPTHTRTAIGILCRQFLGWPRDDLEGGVNFMLEQGGVPKWGARGDDVDWYYWYFGTMVTFQMGEDYFKQWNASMRDLLCDKQIKGGDNDGSWEPTGKYASEGRVLSTAFGALCLEIYYRYSPLYR